MTESRSGAAANERKVVAKGERSEYITRFVGAADKVPSVNSDGAILFHLSLNAMPTDLQIGAEHELRFAAVFLKQGQGNELVQLSEEYVVLCTENGQFFSRDARWIFKSIDPKYVNIEGMTVFLVVRVVKRGALQDGKAGVRHYDDPIRRVVLAGAAPVRTEQALAHVIDVEIPLYASGNENLSGALHEILATQLNASPSGSGTAAANAANAAAVNANKKLTVQARLFQSSFDSLKLQHPELKEFVCCDPINLPEAAFQGDTRNDLYATLEDGEFGEKNVEITVSYKQNGVEQNPEFSGGVSSSKLLPDQGLHRSCTALTSTPKLKETICLRFPKCTQHVHEGYLFFEARHIPTSYDPSAPRPKVFAVGALQLGKLNASITDGVHRVYMFKPSSKIASPQQYAQMSEKESKVFLNVRTQFCSSSTVTNEYLVKLSKWIENQSQLVSILDRVTFLDPFLLLKHHKMIFTSLLDIMEKAKQITDKAVAAFNTFVSVINAVVEFRNVPNAKSLVETFVKEYYASTPKPHYQILLGLCMHVFQTSIDQNFCKVLHYVMLFIVASAASCQALSTMEFGGQIYEFIRTYKGFLMCTDPKALSQQLNVIQAFPKILALLCNIFPPDQLKQEVVEFFGCFDSMKHKSEQKKDNTRLLLYLSIITSELCQNDTLRNDLLGMILEQMRPIFDAHVQLMKQFAERERGPTRDLTLTRAELEEEERTNACVKVIDILGLVADISTVWVADLASRDAISCYLLRYLGALNTIAELFSKSYRGKQRETAARRLTDCVFCALGIVRSASPEIWEQFLASMAPADRMSLLTSLFKTVGYMLDGVLPARWGSVNANLDVAVLKLVALFAQSAYVNEICADKSAGAIGCITSFFQTGLKLLAQDRYKGNVLSLSKDCADVSEELVKNLQTVWSLVSGRMSELFSLTYYFLPLVTLEEGTAFNFGSSVFFAMLMKEFATTGNLVQPENFIFDALEKSDTITMTFIGSFCDNLKKQFENSSPELKAKGEGFVKRIKSFGTRFALISSPKVSQELKGFAVKELINYLTESGRQSLVPTYCIRLYELHRDERRDSEAGHVLAELGGTYAWSSAVVPALVLKGLSLPQQTSFERREALYREAIKTLSATSEWEVVIRLLNEISDAYESRRNFKKISGIIREIESYYKKIIDVERPPMTYYRIGFYGRKFPRYLRNKEFIFHTSLAVRLQDFTKKLEDQFAGASILKKTDAPGDEVRCADTMAMLVTPVTPSTEEESKGELKSLTHLGEGTNVFLYSKPKKLPIKTDNEFLSLALLNTYMVTKQVLPSATSVSEVITKTELEFSPLENAYRSVVAKNDEIASLKASVESNAVPLNSLTMTLNGVISAGVNGGIPKYKEAFLCKEYASTHPTEAKLISKLREAIDDQMDLLDAGMALHKQRVPEEMRELHDHLEKALMDTKKAWREENQ